MKKNRTLFWILIIAAPMLITAIGCKKFLDRKPLTSTLDDLNQGALQGQVFGMYNILRTYAGFSLLPWLDFHSIRDDDAQKGSDINDGKEVVTEFDTYQYTKDDWAPNTYWNDHYAMINATNDALYLADSLKVNDDASFRNVGEACFFRAYSYWELVKTYGQVPLINYRIVNPGDGIRDKASLTELYAFIDSNLQVAAQYLPLDASSYGSDQYKGRLTRGAANTLWAETYLFRQNWGQVVALCNQVIASGQYRLLKNFSDNFKDGLSGVGKNSDESIFEMNATAGQNASSNGSVDNGTDFGTSQQVRQNGTTNDWNLGWGWNTPTQNLVTAWKNFDSTDPRMQQTVLFSGQYDGGPALGGFGATLPAYTTPDGSGGLAQKYWNKKLYTGNDPAMRAFTGWIRSNGAARWINHRIYRYDEVILMLAEAANEMGDGPTAEANLELIRNRASGNLGISRTVLPHITYVNQAQMRTAIKDERRFELAMEGKRFYDLVRWGDADAVLGGLGYTHKARYYPIPQQAIDLTGGVLKQNPEW